MNPNRATRRPLAGPAGVESRSRTHPPLSIWRGEDELTVWCDDWQLAGRNLILTVGDEITHSCTPSPGAALTDLFRVGAAVEQPAWNLELYQVGLPAGELVPRISGHVSAIRAVTCLRHHTQHGHVEDVLGSGVKTPVGSTAALLPGQTQLGTGGRPALVGFLLTLTHPHLDEYIANPLLGP